MAVLTQTLVGERRVCWCFCYETGWTAFRDFAITSRFIQGVSQDCCCEGKTKRKRFLTKRSMRFLSLTEEKQVCQYIRPFMCENFMWKAKTLQIYKLSQSDSTRLHMLYLVKRELKRLCAFFASDFHFRKHRPHPLYRERNRAFCCHSDAVHETHRKEIGQA